MNKPRDPRNLETIAIFQLQHVTGGIVGHVLAGAAIAGTAAGVVWTAGHLKGSYQQKGC